MQVEQAKRLNKEVKNILPLLNGKSIEEIKYLFDCCLQKIEKEPIYIADIKTAL